MRKFEIPYNFDKNLIKLMLPYKDSIEFFYLPPFQKDSIDARTGITTATVLYPKEREEYNSHISNFIKNDMPFAVLLQDPDKKIDIKIVENYINLGVKRFIVNRDDLAEEIKEKFPEIKLVSSITKCITLQQLLNNHEKYKRIYDSIVLSHRFNLSVNKLKLLPKDLKYTFLLTDKCIYNCKHFISHWFNKEDNGKFICFARTKNRSDIVPDALHLFDEYAYSYKLQGRDLESERILEYFLQYKNIPYFEDIVERKAYFNKHKMHNFHYIVRDEESGDLIGEYTQEENMLIHYNKNTI